MIDSQNGKQYTCKGDDSTKIFTIPHRNLTTPIGVMVAKNGIMLIRSGKTIIFSSYVYSLSAAK